MYVEDVLGVLDGLSLPAAVLLGVVDRVCVRDRLNVSEELGVGVGDRVDESVCSREDVDESVGLVVGERVGLEVNVEEHVVPLSP